MARFKIKEHPELREGQNMFNFLEWCNAVKGFQTNQSNRLADPFYFSDDLINQLWDEYKKENL